MTNHWTLPEEYVKAIHNTMGTVRERFASPLNVNERTTEYWAAFRQGRVFGAHYDAYNVQPTSPSERERNAFACIERHQAFALAPFMSRATL